MGFLEGINRNISIPLNSNLALVLLSASCWEEEVVVEEEEQQEEQQEEQEASSSITTHNHRWAAALVQWLHCWAPGRNHRLASRAIKANPANNQQA
jgi:hypothetical protein